MYCPKCGSERMTLCKNDKSIAGRDRYRCGECKARTTKPLTVQPQRLRKVSKVDAKRFIITSAVNDTPIDKDVFNVLQTMSALLDAELLVVPGVYKNPDRYHAGALDSYTWPTEVTPYIVDNNLVLNKNLTLMGAVRITHTAINPLSGMNSAAGTTSEIYGHSQVAMEMVPTPRGHHPKMLVTTGTVSKPNFSGSKLGTKARAHYTRGALYAEISGGKFWTTPLLYDKKSKSICLYNTQYYADHAVENIEIPAVVYGDTHIRWLSKKALSAYNQIDEILQPNVEVFHDLHDHHIGSHHTHGDKIFALQKSLAKEWSIRKELDLSVNFLRGRHNPVVIGSNHHDHLDKWFNRFRPERDPVNAELYYELGGLLRQAPEQTLFESYVASRLGDHVAFPEQYSIHKIHLDQHGHAGPNGARGSAKAFARSGVDTIIGHAHTPRWEKRCVQVGTSVLQVPYTGTTFSSWCMTHAVIYPNGKRGYIWIIDDKLPPTLLRGKRNEV